MSALSLRCITRRLAALPLALLLCAPASAATQVTVLIHDYAFEPRNLVIAPGTEVIWKNADAVPHNIVGVGADAHLRSPALDQDDSYRSRFPSSGEFDYVCGLHPHMQGHISVRP
ncbi:cupredoxin domain-containing protein [Plasticicumulans acidivorans]|uniref:Plastocyanin n=1 Tax=Plasticicumulans acidivorans TaxID=886464 RepID=A0A317MQK0_9GAMM|nr:plastocyanin/azurin family copper-binding protein [Plasticicumulans acidivorans]PWV58734.1 plastocyanin [Plasticicumulans acidivorans]